MSAEQRIARFENEKQRRNASVGKRIPRFENAKPLRHVNLAKRIRMPLAGCRPDADPEAAARATVGDEERFKRDFLERSFGHSCKVRGRMWFDNNLTRIGNIRNERHRYNAIEDLSRVFGDGKEYGDYTVCASCKGSLTSGKVPSMSVSHGFRYPPRPTHVPELNPMEERIISFRYSRS